MSVLSKVQAFPEAFVWDISKYIEQNLLTGTGVPLGDVKRRTIRDTDANMSIGVVAAYMQPREDAQGGYQIGQPDPHLHQHRIEVWSLAKNYDEEAGAQQHSVLARNVRRMMAGNRELHAILAQNEDVYEGRTERFARLIFERQRFFANEIAAQFHFLAVTEIVIETENI